LNKHGGGWWCGGAMVGSGGGANMKEDGPNLLRKRWVNHIVK